MTEREPLLQGMKGGREKQSHDSPIHGHGAVGAVPPNVPIKQ